MSVTLYIKSGAAFSYEDLKDVLPSCKLIKDYEQLEAENNRLRLALERISDWPDGAQSEIARNALDPQ